MIFVPVVTSDSAGLRPHEARLVREPEALDGFKSFSKEAAGYPDMQMRVASSQTLHRERENISGGHRFLTWGGLPLFKST